MGIETDLDVSPYFDDANNAINDNYHRILFRPSVPVQARELTQLQDILQNQIERFGDQIFVAGTIIKGCNFNFDSSYDYAKILDLRPLDSQPANPSEYVGLMALEPTSNLYAICYDYQDGFESQDPNLKTLYFKYLNTGENNESRFPAGSQLEFYETTEITAANSITLAANLNVTIASTANAVGVGYSMSVSAGIIFQKGHFIQVSNNTTTIVSKYTNSPNNVVAGFLINENIITELQDQNLYDQAIGSSNYSAPGAHRLQLEPILTSYPADAAPANNFLALVEWENGNIVKSFQQTQYSGLGNELARRTYEESGDYFIKPFKINMETANETHNSLITSAGLAYIDGHRVEQLNNISIPIRKGTDIKRAQNQAISTNFNNSILINEYVGNIPSNIGATVSLRSVAGTKITSRGYGTITASGVELGTAKVFAVEYESGTVGSAEATYRVYLSNIKMNTGKTFTEVKSIFYSGTYNGYADIVLVLDPTSSSNIALLSEPSKSTLVFPTAKTGLAGISSTGNLPDYVYRSVNTNITISSATGNSNLLELTGTTIFPYGTGQLSAVQEQEIIVIPIAYTGGAAAANVTSSTAGNVAITSGSAVVVPYSSEVTAFTSEYLVGDYINIANQIRRITNISNATHMAVDTAWTTSNATTTHKKCYPLNVPINFSDRASYFTVTDSPAQHMRVSLSRSNTATTTNETLSTDMTVAIYYNALNPADTDRNLQANTNVVVKINTSNNAGDSNGPWCLGVPYAYNLKAVYKSTNTGILIANTNSNTIVNVDTTGLSNGMAIFGSNIPAGATANVANSTALVLSAAATSSNNEIALKYAFYSNSASDDVTKAFIIQDGQKDAFFDQSFLKKNSNYGFLGVGKDDLLTVVFDVFSPQNTGKGYISVDSYATIINTTNLIGFEDVPEYTSSSGIKYQLRDSIDFRPFVSNTAVITNTFSSATINPPYLSNLSTSENYIAAPNQTFKYSTDYYLGRVDKVLINSYGAYSVIEGVAAENPIPPTDKVGSMTLATVSVPPIPTLVAPKVGANSSVTYVTTFIANQNRGYTMRDIGKIDRRIDALEYYTALSLLELQTSSLNIISGVTGANRFKNGIFVDNFTTLDSQDITNREFRAGLSDLETALVPRFVPTKVALKFANGINVSRQGDAVTLANTSRVQVINQKFATDQKAVTDAIYNYIGGVSLSPSYDDVPDITTTPVPEVRPIVNSTPNTTPNTTPNYTTSQLGIEVYDLGSRFYGAFSGYGSNFYPATSSSPTTRVFYGFTGTGKIPAGLVQIVGTNDNTSRALMNGYFGTNLQGRFVVFQYGYFIAPQTGTYTFRSFHDDDIQLKINGTNIIYNNAIMTNSSVNGSFEEGTPIDLTAGRLYTFYLAWYDNNQGITKFTLDYKIGTGSYQALQSSNFARDNITISPCIAITTGTTLTTNTAYGALTYSRATPNTVTSSTYTVNNALAGGSTFFSPPATNTSTFVATPTVTTNTQIVPVTWSTGWSGYAGYTPTAYKIF
jgi:hypothetical protein